MFSDLVEFLKNIFRYLNEYIHHSYGSNPHLTQISDLVEDKKQSHFVHMVRMLHHSSIHAMTSSLVPVSAHIDVYFSLKHKKCLKSLCNALFAILMPFLRSHIFRSGGIFEKYFFDI